MKTESTMNVANDKMRSIVIDEAQKVSYGECPAPHLEAGQVLVKIERIGYCGSDLNTYRGLNPLVAYPRIPGHEIGGIIAEIAADVPKNLEHGQKVTVIPYTACGKCSACQKGRFNVCKENQTLGVQREGALTNYIAVPHEKVLTSEKLEVHELALVEPLAVGFHAASRARVESTDTVAIIGVGMIGLGAVSAAALQRKARVIAIDVDDRKLDLARKAGATEVINTQSENLHERLLELTNGNGPDVMIEAVGLVSTFQSCIEEVCYAGRVVYIGYAKEQVPYETKLFLLKELDIMGSRGANPQDFQEVMAMLEDEAYPASETITRSVPFEEGAQALADWHADPSSITKIQVEL